METAWKHAACMERLADTPENRRAFYAGGRYLLSAIVDALRADVTYEMAASLNDGLHGFAIVISQKETA